MCVWHSDGPVSCGSRLFLLVSTNDMCSRWGCPSSGRAQWCMLDRRAGVYHFLRSREPLGGYLRPQSVTEPLTDIKCTRGQICQMLAECHGNGKSDTVYNKRGVAEMHSQLLKFLLVSCRRRKLTYTLNRNGELSSSVEGECCVR